MPSGTSLYGKIVDELQSDVVINGFAVTGTLHYLTDYTDFSSKLEEQSGNYLALRFDANPQDSKIMIEFIGAVSTTEPFELPIGDRDCVFRISNKDTQSIKMVVIKGEDTQTKTLSLSGLTLEPAA